jgi:hypothetical protein
MVRYSLVEKVDHRFNFSSGMPWEETVRDPALLDKRTSLVKQAATLLDQNRMISFDRTALTFVITDLGRIAAKYYIRHKSIELFNQMMRPKMTEADVLAMLSKSTEVRLYNSQIIMPTSILTSSLFSLSKFKFEKMRLKSSSNSWKPFHARSRFVNPNNAIIFCLLSMCCRKEQITMRERSISYCRHTSLTIDRKTLR